MRHHNINFICNHCKNIISNKNKGSISLLMVLHIPKENINILGILAGRERHSCKVCKNISLHFPKTCANMYHALKVGERITYENLHNKNVDKILLPTDVPFLNLSKFKTPEHLKHEMQHHEKILSQKYPNFFGNTYSLY